MERRKILKGYLLSLVVIFCIFTFFAGTITVSERTRYNMDLTSYGEITLEEKADGIKISLGEKEIFVEREVVEKMGRNAFYAVMGDVFSYIGEFFEKNVN